MTKLEIIEGLKCLIEDRKSFLTDGDSDDDIFLEDIKVLKEAIKLVVENSKVEFDFKDTGCPMCSNYEAFVCLNTDFDFEIHECRNCGSQIKVRVIKEIVEVGTENQLNN